MNCLVCDLTSVEDDSEIEDEDEILSNLRHRSLLLSTFCKYFNWENNCNLTPSQLLSWVSTSSTSKSSSFPFCTKCENRMNELNELHSNLEKIQLYISTIIASMSMEIIKVVDSYSHSSSTNCKAKPIATPNQFKSVGEFRNHVYKQFKPQVRVQKCQETTTTTTPSWNNLHQLPLVEASRPPFSGHKTEMKDAEQEEQNVDHDEDSKEGGSISIKDEPLSPAPVSSPFKDDNEDTYEQKYSDDDSDDDLSKSSSSSSADEEIDPGVYKEDQRQHLVEEQNEEYSKKRKPRKIIRPKRKYTKSIKSTDKNEDHNSSPFHTTKRFMPSPYEKETFPGSNIFLYHKWEYTRISDTACKCLTCGSIRPGRKHIREHINRVHNNERNNCDKCGYKWATKEGIDNHKCKPSQRRVRRVEEVSPGKFLYLKKFHYQKVDKNSNEEGLEFLCLNGTCRKLIRTQSNMHAHIRKCHDDLDPSLICEICGKTSTSLRTHMLTHSEERSNVCDICGKGFKTKKSLKIHRDLHQGRGFVCGFQGCTRSYTNPSSLGRHRKDADHPAKKKLHNLIQCPHCSKMLLGEERFARHISSLKCIIHQVYFPTTCKPIRCKQQTANVKSLCMNKEFPDNDRFF